MNELNQCENCCCFSNRPQSYDRSKMKWMYFFWAWICEVPVPPYGTRGTPWGYRYPWLRTPALYRYYDPQFWKSQVRPWTRGVIIPTRSADLNHVFVHVNEADHVIDYDHVTWVGIDYVTAGSDSVINGQTVTPVFPTCGQRWTRFLQRLKMLNCDYCEIICFTIGTLEIYVRSFLSWKFRKYQ